MEDHFLLKLPDKLQTIIDSQIHNKTYNFEIYTKNDEIVFKLNEKEYKTIYYDIPTVIEIQKTMDKSQFYKAGNVSNCLYVIDEESTEVCEETKNSTNSNMKKVDIATKNVFDEDLSSKSKETNKDSNLQNMNEQKKENNNSIHKILSDDDVHELEKNVKNHKITKKYSKKNVKYFLELSGMSPCLRYCKIKRFKSKPQVFMKSQEQEQKVKQLLERERMSSHIEIIYIGEDETSDVSSLAAEIEYNLDNEDKKVMCETIKNKKELLVELQEKIKGKEQQLETVNNLIMKKRFMDNINALKSEFETLSNEIKELENHQN